MEGKLYLGSIIAVVAAILLYKLLRFMQKTEEDEGGVAVQVTIGLWSGIIALLVMSIIFFLQAFFKLN